MGLVRAWTRQVARAAGASLIAPLVLLLAAGVVASAGGLGGIRSLGQIASGPPLPDTGLETASSSSFKKAEIVGTDVRPQAVETTTTPAAPSPEALASASVPGTRAPVGAPTTPVPTGPSTTTRPLRPDTGDSTPSLTDNGRGGTTPPARRRPAGNLVEGLRETTQGLSNALPEPLRPVTNNLIDLLLGPPPR